MEKQSRVNIANKHFFPIGTGKGRLCKKPTSQSLSCSTIYLLQGNIKTILCTTAASPFKTHKKSNVNNVKENKPS